MTVMLVNLLKAAGIEAHPALVNTRNKCNSNDEIIKLDYNHMITYVKVGGEDQFWLDATGSSCPLGEVYPSIEGTKALVLYEDGNSDFKVVPKSKSKRNRLERKISLQLNNDGSVNGTANITFKGNENLAIRSGFFDASENDIHKVMESYVNSNTPDLKIDSLIYDDPNQIGKEFSMRTEFSKDKIGSFDGDLLIFKPYIFELEPELDRYRDEERTHPLFFNSPTYIYDDIEVEYDPEVFGISSLGKNISENYNLISRDVLPGDSRLEERDRKDYGIQLIDGAEWYVKKNISLFVEYVVSFNFMKVTNYNESEWSSQTAEETNFNITNSGARLGVSLYF